MGSREGYSAGSQYSGRANSARARAAEREDELARPTVFVIGRGVK